MTPCFRDTGRIRYVTGKTDDSSVIKLVISKQWSIVTLLRAYLGPQNRDILGEKLPQYIITTLGDSYGGVFDIGGIDRAR